MKNNLLFVLSFILFFININSLQSQNLSSKGKDFWLGFMQNEGTNANLLIYISADAETSGTVSIPGNGWTQNFNVSANSTTQIVVPTIIAIADVAETPENKGVHITSVGNISVFALNYVPYTADATLIFPTKTLDTEYYTCGYNAIDFGEYPSLLLVVATEDNTSIEITPSSTTTTGSPGNIPFTITLDAGQTFQVESNTDLTGSYVKGIDPDKKIAVFGGSTCSFVSPDCYACDHLFEQMPPRSRWGKEFITVPLKTRTGDIFRVVAAETNTQVSINGTPPVTLNSGDFFETMLIDANFITSTQPILLMQYSRGSDCDGTTADPFMIVISPVKQAIDTISFNAFTSDVITNYYLNVIAKTTETSTIKLDASDISGMFVPVNSNNTYSIAQIDITEGNHTIGTGGCSGIIAYVYGYGEYESYGYSAGTNLIDLEGTFDVGYNKDTLAYGDFDGKVCMGDTVKFLGIFDVNIISYTWDFGDGTTDIGQLVEHTYNSIGNFNVTVKIEFVDGCEPVTINVPIEVGFRILTEDTLKICLGQLATLTPPLQASSYLWNNNLTTQSIQVSPSENTQFICEMPSNNCGGNDKSVFTVIVENLLPINLGTETEICQQLTLDAGTQQSGNLLYNWSNGATTQTITTSEPNIYSVTVSNSGGCSVSSSIELTKKTLTATVNPDVTICLGEQAQLNAQGGDIYEWIPNTGLNNPNIANPIATPNNSVQYLVIVKDADLCAVDSAQVAVTVNQAPIVSAGNDIAIIEGGITQLNASGALSYTWTPTTGLSDPNIANPIINSLAGSTYTVVGTDANGCTASDAVSIKITGGFLVPNSFSPNEDGINDVFKIITSYQNATVNTFYIYNRYGQRLYSGNNINEGWDGTYKNQPQEIGVYVYVIIAEVDGKKTTLKGNITLVR